MLIPAPLTSTSRLNVGPATQKSMRALHPAERLDRDEVPGVARPRIGRSGGCAQPLLDAGWGFRARARYSTPDSSPTTRSRSPLASHARLRVDSVRRCSTPALSSSSIAFVTAGLVLFVAATATG